MAVGVSQRARERCTLSWRNSRRPSRAKATLSVLTHAIGETATRHGRDLLAMGFIVSSVVHDCGGHLRGGYRTRPLRIDEATVSSLAWAPESSPCRFSRGFRGARPPALEPLHGGNNRSAMLCRALPARPYADPSRAWPRATAFLTSGSPHLVVFVTRTDASERVAVCATVDTLP